MSASDFLRKVTAEEIAQASDAADAAEDAARGMIIDSTDYRQRMEVRLRDHYPGIHKRIVDLLNEQAAVSPEELFLMGVYAGATMLAHDITVAAEVYDAQQMFGESQDKPSHEN